MTNSFQNILVTSFPDISEITFKNIEKKYLNVIIINTIFIFLLLFIAVFFAVYKDIFNLKEYKFWLYVLYTVILVFTLFIKIVGFKKRKFAVREKDISYKNGIFFKKLTTVPFNRVQHVEIDQGPIARFFGLVTLSVFTAGDSSDDLKIRGLLSKNALEIKEFISNKIDG
ncbi:hypothetical protein FDT66_00075 [Polaribacter aestuariivivens]|uniref:YdbS-like PH domain-containing protein n=1 Tax=Polaribacter aestuariivivens TaxID=2304626 RepID=A0A5S3N9N9_9FLAO|nr:PH domain-containing protein [Polaribacter aestuariivivens]TMM31903.1 hypothetical protein FDT66_00075 [Polaribacter aestuariivivens]